MSSQHLRLKWHFEKLDKYWPSMLLVFWRHYMRTIIVIKYYRAKKSKTHHLTLNQPHVCPCYIDPEEHVTAQRFLFHIVKRFDGGHKCVINVSTQVS